MLKGYKVGQKVCVVKKEGIGEEASISLLKGKVISIGEEVKVNILNTKRVISFNNVSREYFYDIKYFLFKNERTYRNFIGDKTSYNKDFINIETIKGMFNKSFKTVNSFLKGFNI